MDFLYEPLEAKDATGFEPLEWDDEDYEDEDDALPYDDDSFEEDEYEEPELPGFDDLRPFGSFDDRYGWEDGYL